MRHSNTITLSKADKITVRSYYAPEFYVTFQAHAGSTTTIFMSRKQLEILSKALVSALSEP